MNLNRDESTPYDNLEKGLPVIRGNISRNDYYYLLKNPKRINNHNPYIALTWKLKNPKRIKKNNNPYIALTWKNIFFNLWGFFTRLPSSQGLERVRFFA